MRNRSLLWIAALIAALLYIFLAGYVLLDILPRYGLDLAIYLDAAGHAWQGRSPYLPYEPGVSFVYPPSALLLFSPLLPLPLASAKTLWYLVNASAYGAALLLLFRALRPQWQPFQRVWISGLFLLYAPFLEALAVGQVDCLVLLGLCAFLWGLTSPRCAWLGDLGLAAAIAIKISPIVLVLLPLFRRDWRRCARIAGGAAGLALLALPFFGLRPWLDFLTVLPRILAGFPYTLNQAVGPSLQWLVAGGTTAGPIADWSSRLFSLAVLGLWALACALRARQADPLPLAALGLVAMTISSSLVWYHHLTFLTIPLAYLFLRAGDHRALIGGALALALIQADRLVEYRLGLPPFLAIAAYLLLFVILLLHRRAASCSLN